jgi:hypothetical protein
MGSYIVKVNDLFVLEISLQFDTISLSEYRQEELELTRAEIEWIRSHFDNVKFYEVTKIIKEVIL